LSLDGEIKLVQPSVVVGSQLIAEPSLGVGDHVRIILSVIYVNPRGQITVRGGVFGLPLLPDFVVEPQRRAAH